ncbi:ATP-dependent RNA helicase [Spironucleus salmonicida]|uniref:ATP-dependent RNA helicase n=1 Tax=Spironucleus salmonicida TaxID=348837 RepID=V6LZ07_9EUKA|nr:ATP-dependent RNA helicase [Spironucleus salmonicida]|eukprot:EST46069.1 ATP-dependent RNA helicase [Spironucleus salmonicida]
MELLEEDFRIDNQFSESDNEQVSKNPLIAAGLSEDQAAHVRKLGFHKLTDIQKQSLPLLCAGSSAIIVSRTGSGKTLAYSLPILKKLIEHRGIAGIRSIILAPTRELALQITRVIRQLSSYSSDPLRIALLTGGDSLEQQFEVLANNPDIIVATPGRLLFHIEQVPQLEGLLKTVEYMVIDEADQMFEQQLLPQVQDIIAKLKQPQTVLCSATLPTQLSDFTKACMKSPKLIQAESESLPDELTSVHILCGRDDKLSSFLHIFREVMPLKWRVLMFVSTRYHAEYIHEVLSGLGIKSSPLYGTMDQEQRNLTLAAFKTRQTRVLIATDVAARGVDIEQLECVVNFNFPFNSRVYLHRGGRAARAGKFGLYLNLIDQDEFPYLLDALLHAQLPIQYDGEQISVWEDVNKKLLSCSVQFDFQKLNFNVEDGKMLKYEFKKYIASYFEENLQQLIKETVETRKIEKTEAEVYLALQFKRLYQDIGSMVAGLEYEAIQKIRQYLIFCKNAQELGNSPYQFSSYVGKLSKSLGSVIGSIPQQLVDTQTSRLQNTRINEDPQLILLQGSIKNSLQQLNKQKRSATFQSFQRAKQISASCGFHPVFAQFYKIKQTTFGEQKARLDIIQNFKITTDELLKKASDGDESASVQLKVRRLIEKKRRIDDATKQQIFGEKTTESQWCMEGLGLNTPQMVRELDEKIKKAVGTDDRQLLVQRKASKQAIQIKDIAADLIDDENLRPSGPKKIWDSVKGRWVSIESQNKAHKEKDTLKMDHSGQWQKVEKEKQFYQKWVKKSKTQVSIAGSREENTHRDKFIGQGEGRVQKRILTQKATAGTQPKAVVTTYQDKQLLDRQLDGKAAKKKTETKASRMSKVAQKIKTQGKDYHKELDRKRAKGKRVEDNKWRNMIKRSK